jgi:glutamate dehydrogenase/leucine dehydrogenase
VTEHSLINPLKSEGLTGLRVQYDRRDDSFVLAAAREWDEVDWSRYTTGFSHETTLTTQSTALGTDGVWDLFAAHGARGYLEEVCSLLRAGGHERMELWIEPRLDMWFFNNVHSSHLGLSNGHHAIRSGGIRRHEKTDDELDVIVDGLNLARGMSYKNAAAGLPFGGCKSVVVCGPVDLSDNETMGFIAYCIDRTRSFTGPDMGLEPALADVMNERFSRNFGGGTKKGVGPSGPPTGYGNFLALKVACEAVFDTTDLRGRSAVVSGMGSVGSALARYLLTDGVRLFITDIDGTTVTRFTSGLSREEAARVDVVAPGDALAVQADIFAPCAQGGLLCEENIPTLPFRIVMGSANNVLRAGSREEEIRLAGLLAEAGIVYQVEWVHNMGGVLSGIETYLHGEEASMANVHEVIEKRVPPATRYNLAQAEREQVSPTEIAYRVVEPAVYGGADEVEE